MFRIFLQTLGVTSIFLFIMLAATTDVAQEHPLSELNLASPLRTSTSSPVTSAEESTSATSSSSNEEAQKAPRTEPVASRTLQEEMGPGAAAALVNILCNSASGNLPISGSGVIIDPRGVILTNAHVAQFLLLDSHPDINLSCVIRSGSPAKALWNASILYMPSAWVEVHAGDIAKSKPTGTGEEDFAILVITSTIDGRPLPSSFPYIPYDTREKVHNSGSTVLLTAYPAEFAGDDATKGALLAFSTLTTIKSVLTFKTDTIDVFSFGAAALAQSGSSGGSVIADNGRLIGIISTTSDGPNLAQRDLRAVTLSYINRALTQATGQDLDTTLLGDVAEKARQFMHEKAPALSEMIVKNLPR